MTKKTALQEFLEQIVLKQVEGSVYLLPAITDIQIKEALEKEIEQIKEAFVAGDERGTNDIPFNAEQYYLQVYGWS
jgi:hypothetical protein